VNSTAIGIIFRPSTADARLFVSDTLFQNSGNGTSGGGLIVQPAGSGSARVVLDRVRVESNTTGIFLMTPAGTTGIQLAIQDSNVSGNNFTGIYSVSGGPTITAIIDRTSISDNAGIGLLSQGANSFVFVSHSTITGNGTGWAFTGGGNLVSYGNNNVHLNLTPHGTPSGHATQR